MKWFYSLRYRMLILIGAIVLLMSTFVISYNVSIYQMKDQQFLTLQERTLEFYAKKLGDALSDVEKFLVSQNQMGEVFQKLNHPKKEMDRYLAELEIVKYYRDSIERFRDIDGLFIYSPQAEIYQGCTGSGVSAKENTTIKYHIEQLIERFEETDQQSKEWFSIKLGDEYYLIKILDLQGTYVGSWVRADRIAEQVGEIANKEKEYIVRIYDRAGTAMNENGQEQIRKDDYIEVSAEVETKGFFVTLLVEKNRGMLDMANPAMSSAIMAILSLVLVVVACWVTFQRLLMRPLNHLVAAMSRLKRGDLDATVETKEMFEEFQTVNETFESMKKEIRQLKIDIYEEMLNKQNAELLYLQVQIDPHFLTNCMNLIRNLSLCGENEKVEEAVIYLSKYMRYSLTNSTMIPLERELEHVGSYWRLQKLRYGEQIDIEIIMDPSLGKLYVPTMLIQTFVDNSVKHQMSPEMQLKIKIIITVQRDYNIGKCLNVFIQDNGEGFENETMKKLQNHEIIYDVGKEHIGIYNVYQRLDILYHNKFKLLFTNGKAGGAIVSIDLPIEAMEEKKG